MSDSYSQIRWFILWGRRRGQCWDTDTPSPRLFHCGVLRDGRDYERITHCITWPPQTRSKPETIKARVKATAVSSFKCLPHKKKKKTPLPGPAAAFPSSTVSIPNLSTSGTHVSPSCMNSGQQVGLCINPSKQCKQSSKWSLINIKPEPASCKACIRLILIRHDTGHNS